MKFKFRRLRRAAMFAFVGVLAPVLADSQSAVRTCVLTWTPPTLNSDGTPLTDLAGYYIYTGNSPENVIASYFAGATARSMVLTFPVSASSPFFAVTAVNTDGLESDLTPILQAPILQPTQ